VVIAVAAALLLHFFVVQTYFIPSGSMEPTLQIGDRILVDKLAYKLHGVHQGDIVVFARPPKENCAGPPVPDLVKRVIGLPGQTISLSGTGNIEIDGKTLNQSWLPASEQGKTFAGPTGTPYSLVHPYKIPANNYFVMGDNRQNSCDSRTGDPSQSHSLWARSMCEFGRSVLSTGSDVDLFVGFLAWRIPHRDGRNVSSTRATIEESPERIRRKAADPGGPALRSPKGVS